MSDGRTAGSFGWNELATTDTASARAFYGALLGWTFDEMPMPGGGGSYIIAKVGDQMVGGMFKMQGEQFKGIPPHWMGYITVSDVDGAAKRVPSLGGKVHMPPTDIPGVGRFCVISDSTGAHVSLMQWAPQAG